MERLTSLVVYKNWVCLDLVVGVLFSENLVVLIIEKFINLVSLCFKSYLFHWFGTQGLDIILKFSLHMKVSICFRNLI